MAGETLRLEVVLVYVRSNGQTKKMFHRMFGKNHGTWPNLSLLLFMTKPKSAKLISRNNTLETEAALIKNK